jgi:gluconate 2-dehydrogenase gamma chain
MGEREDETSRGFTRASLLKRAGALGVAAVLPAGGLVGSAEAQTAAGPTDQLRALTSDQAVTLEAILERLIPSDETGPGAKEAKVLRYIDWSLAGDLSMFREPYSAALDAVDAYASSKFGAAFAELSPEQQDAVLTDMDKGVATGFTPSAKAVFEMIRGHAVQGMFCDPAHGGNEGFVGWKLVRFPGPRLSISAHDQKLDVKPKEKLMSTYDYELFKPSKRGGRG